MKKLILFCVVILAFIVLFNYQGYAQRITITLFETSSLEESEIIKHLISEFQKGNPDIRVNYVGMPQRDIVQKVTVSAMAGVPPDVFPTTAFDAPLFISAEIVEPLDNLLTGSNINIDDFITRLVEAFRSGGQIYGIPKKFDSLALFYNRDLFQEAGVSEPTDNWNWDDLCNAARELKEGGIEYSIMFSDLVQNFLPFAFANGASILNEEDTEAFINSDEAVEALDFYSRLFEQGLSVLSANVGLGWAGQAFVNDEVAIVFEGSWLLSYINKANPELDYGVVRIPASRSGGHGNVFFAQAYSVPSGLSEEAKIAALKLINFLTSEEAQNLWLELGIGFASRQSFAESPFLVDHPAFLKVYEGIEDGIAYSFGARGYESLKVLETAIERLI